MIHDNINFNSNIATDVRLFNPFGPNMFFMRLNDDYILKLLEIVENLNTDEIKEASRKKGQIIHGTKADENQKNSLVDGEIFGIDPAKLSKDEETFIRDLIHNLSLTYGEIVNSHMEKDIALKDDTDAIESIKLEGKRLKVKIEAIWYVKMRQGDFHILHEHSSSGATLSGAIYLDVPELPWPQGNINWIPPGGPNTMYNSTWQLNPKPGDLIMWPSWLLHTVYPFRSKETRTMISFNSVILSPRDKKNDK